MGIFALGQVIQPSVSADRLMISWPLSDISVVRCQRSQFRHPDLSHFPGIGRGVNH
jgi:hypothetical protein